MRLLHGIKVTFIDLNWSKDYSTMATRGVEDYLETIYDIVEKKGYARVSEIASALNIQPSSVSEMLKRLKEMGYVDYERYGVITLTDKGRALAESVREKHIIIKEFLELLGVSSAIAEADACKMEHLLDPQTLERLSSFVKYVKVKGCPKWLVEFKRYAEANP